ncbi:OsmC family protein [Fulvivirgaceae bacterium LMO-SS25]
METTTHFVSDYEYEAINESGNKVQIDMYSREEKKNHSPTELLLSALSACASVDLVQMLKKRKKTVNALEVRAVGNRRDEIPKSFTNITLYFKLTSPDATIEEFEKLAHLAATKYCSVAATLNCEIKHEYKVIRP